MPEQQPEPNDPGDFTGMYNTQLSPEDEAKFQDWATWKKRLGDLYDYDLRGWWKSGQSIDPATGQDVTGHLPDTYKKPNHPTFSNESIYHGVDGWQGGHWTPPEGGGDKGWMFAPGDTRIHSDEELDNYFKQVEPGNSWQHSIGTGGSRFYDPNARGAMQQTSTRDRLGQLEAEMQARQRGTLPRMTGEEGGFGVPEQEI